MDLVTPGEVTVTREIRRTAGCGSTLVVRDPGLDRQSLSLDGGRLAWRGSTGPGSAPLCPAPAASPGVERSPVRLVHGPLVFRVHGRGDPSTFEENIRYASIGEYSRLYGPAIGDAQLARGVDSRYGDVDVLTTPRLGLTDVNDSPFACGSTDCLEAVYSLGEDSPLIFRTMGQIRDGAHVKVRSQPRTPSPDGEPELGKVYVVKATMRRTNVNLRDPVAQKALARVGCSSHHGV